MTYGLPLWYDATNRSSNPHVPKLQAVQNKALRFITGAFITTPIGSMEIISGLPPMKIVVQRLCQCAAVRMKVLSEHHIIHKCFVQPSPLRAHALLKPSKSPIERIRDIYQQTDEISFYTHDERQPGARILDPFANKITFANMHHPPCGSDLFAHWLEDFKHNIVTTNTIFTNGSFHKSTYKAAAAFWVPETRQRWYMHASSSFDTETQALEMAITHISAIQAIFNVSNKHQFMECSIRASNASPKTMTNSPGRPEHTSGTLLLVRPMRNTIDDKMFKAWNLLYASREYRAARQQHATIQVQQKTLDPQQGPEEDFLHTNGK
ncbi:hypothetical protein AX17_002603 [Amanita inopinata Kibby_2008]|nr:hypothetical protein AX17_002603 [Amanita inopinata Kibby_2008]